MELSRVVVGTDFTEASVAAVRWVDRHLVADAELVLFHAIELPQPPSFLRGLLPTAESVSENARYGAEQRLRELAGTLTSRRIRTELRFGGSAESLLAWVREEGADLIVVSDHGSRRGVWTVLGSTSERLVRTAGVPVLVARNLEDAAPSSILAPLDASPASAGVLAWARRLQLCFGARVTAGYAIDVMHAYGRIRTVSAAARAGDLERELRARSVEWLRQRLAEAGFGPDDAGVEVIVGDPRTAIPVMAEHAAADLIVIGSRGAGAVGRAMLGSVAEAVLGSTAYPVLVVRGPSRT